AIADMQMLSDADPANKEWRLQLAQFYSADKRPRKAIETVNDVLKADAENMMAIRIRGDAYLSIGKHAEAVADLEAALKQDPKNSGILNNLSWVLSTSPDDNVRNGKRAVELALQACEATEYKKPHILSTLASAYAESGDWENAVKWSTKAVELGSEGDKEIGEQLQKELDGYKEKKPFREKQETPEKESKPKPSRNDLEI
ncbi:MAG TPA: tetratricopeptide repeat protein, partial [Pirellulaceae bacterium]|nr:tetratricopeptide repeat protein [Pirellulaceae bacterium]